MILLEFPKVLSSGQRLAWQIAVDRLTEDFTPAEADRAHATANIHVKSVGAFQDLMSVYAAIKVPVASPTLLPAMMSGCVNLAIKARWLDVYPKALAVERPKEREPVDDMPQEQLPLVVSLDPRRVLFLQEFAQKAGAACKGSGDVVGVDQVLDLMVSAVVGLLVIEQEKRKQPLSIQECSVFLYDLANKSLPSVDLNQFRGDAA